MFGELRQKGFLNFHDMKDKVSIIIPCYNYGEFLVETLASLIHQSHQNWEAIVVDDGSTDNTESILHPLLKKEKRILFFKQKNKGVSAARNLGLQYVSGDFVQFLDADDLLSPHKISLQLEYFRQNPNVDICYTDNHYFLNGQPDRWFPDQEMEGKKWMPYFFGRGVEAIQALIRNNIAVSSSPLIKKQIVEKSNGFPEDVAHTEDWQFWFDCAFNGACIHYFSDPEAFCLIRVHHKSVSQDMQTMRYGELNLRNWVKEKIQESSFSTEDKKLLNDENEARKEALFKYIMYHGPLLDPSHLVKMAKLWDWPTVISFYFKALNFRRKTVNKQHAKNRRHHPIECQ